MSLAFLYAGQGSQHPGMGADLYEAHPAFRAVLDAAGVDFDLKTTMFTDPDGVLNLTEYTQPCMVAFAAGITALPAERGIVPGYAAGLPLGPYSALQCAGVFTAPQAISLAALPRTAIAAPAAGRLPAGAPAGGGRARIKGSTAFAPPAPRVRNRDTCGPGGSPATNIPNPKTGARQRSALAVGKQRHSAPPHRPLPHRGKAASKSPNPTIPDCTEPIKRTHKETKAIRSTIRRPTQSVHHSLPGRSFLTTQSKPQSNIAAIMNQGSKKRIHES